MERELQNSNKPRKIYLDELYDKSHCFKIVRGGDIIALIAFNGTQWCCIKIQKDTGYAHNISDYFDEPDFQGCKFLEIE